MAKTTNNYLLLIFMLFSLPFDQVSAQEALKNIAETAAKGLEFRSIGPALMGGRISDIEVSSDDRSTWYVAAGSGNVWKTQNSGITWKPVFDNEASYSIGDIALDPNNQNVVWVGTGENVSGRHVGWGDGIYKSSDSGQSWTNMGLKGSEHIGKILVDPRNSDIIFVAAEGPLWSPGGERGLFKSMDGGASWKLVLEIDENTGVTDIEFAPGNPEVIYAAAYQRRRQVWSLMAGGPKSGIYKSSDGGSSWNKINKGLPSGHMGKIGLGVTPADPDLVYATIEAKSGEQGFYRSTDQGQSWAKQNSYISGGTGPHYYQEIEVSPTNPDVVYQMDVFIHVSRDGGKTFDYLGTGREKHSDNHAMWIDPNNGNHLLAGTDAGLYETFDEGTTWRHFPNMPISQFYKLDIDNSLPFYNILGGAQDLGTLIGPSRTLNAEGVRNQDWYVPLGADGYDSQFDPEDPNIAYMEIQGGLLHRYDKTTEEVINIQPQPAPGDEPERWNWDSPNLISPHDHETIYFGSQRVWKSEDRGDSWEAISGDLTTNTNRYELEMTDRVWSVDDLYDNGAMSLYATLTSIAESWVKEGLIYTGSDDGLVHVTENGGDQWSKLSLPSEIPDRSFVNDIEASRHNENEVFVAIDAHKFGDYKPYLYISENNGKTWKSITGDLPEKTIVWVIKQDHKDENLLFAGTEYGVYFSYNKGENWIKLGKGMPTIPTRDLELHQRDDDLVCATFGRGFYVLDDYSALRYLNTKLAAKESAMLPVRDAWWYIPSVPMQAKGMPTLGSTSYVADNPEFGALLTYYIHDVPQTAKSKRSEAESELEESGTSIPFPGWESLREESKDRSPQVLLLIKDSEGNPVNWIKGNASKGLHRTSWDLRRPAPNPVDLSTPGFVPPWAGSPQGPLVAPGNYLVELHLESNGKLTQLGESQSFEVKPIPAIEQSKDFKAIAHFQNLTSELLNQMAHAGGMMSDAGERLRYLEAAMSRAPRINADHFSTLRKLENDLADLRLELNGDPIRGRLNESSLPSIRGRAGQVSYGHWNTTQEPTTVFKENLDLATNNFEVFSETLETYLEALEIFEKEMREAGAPYTKGSRF